MTGGGDIGRRVDAGCDCKVGRISRRYNLAGLAEDLRNRHEDDASLRELERMVNCALLDRVMRDAGVEIIGSVESVLDTLTDDSASAGDRTEVKSRLIAAGVDVEAVLSDFVSYQTVRTHLQECLGVDTGHRGDFSRADAKGTIEWSRSRNDAVIKRTLDRLRRQEELETGPLEVSSVVRITCSDCGRTFPIDDLLAVGRCDCQPD